MEHYAGRGRAQLFGLAAAGAMVFAAIGAATGGFAAAQTSPAGVDLRPRLVLSVSGQAAAAPDMAEIRVGVVGEGDTAEAAMAMQAARMTAVLAAAGELAASDDISTSGLDLSPIYSQSASYDAPARITGYRASNVAAVVLRDLDGVGPALDALAASGADRIDGVRFDVADRRPLETAARKAALAELAARRAFYEAEAGVSIAGLIELSESGAGGGGGPVMRLAQASATPIAPGDVEAVISLHAVYALAP